MMAIFFNESIQNLHFLCRNMFECFISNLKLVLAFVPFKNMKNNIGSQIRHQLLLYQVWGAPFPCKRKCFGPTPWGPGEGSKSQIFNFIYGQFQRFFTNLVCVLTNQRTKHIRRDFHSFAGVMPQEWELGVLRGQKLNSTCRTVMVSPKPLDQITPNLECE